MAHQTRQGVLFALTAYSLWAIAPVYFKSIQSIPALEILSHRVLWSLLLTLVIIGVLKHGRRLIHALRDRRHLIYLLISTILIAANWGVFIWAVNSDQLLSASLGYYINPLFNIILGMLFFSERLNRSQSIAAFLCVSAVTLEIVNFGQVPWVALVLAGTFAFYALVRKKLGVDSFTGMALETGLLAPFALGYLLLNEAPTTDLLTDDWRTNFLLFLAGPVTMIPLLCFAAAANRISMTALGFFQYIGPSGMFLLAIFIYGEPLVPAKLLTFVIIWSALALLVWDSARKALKGTSKGKLKRCHLIKT